MKVLVTGGGGYIGSFMVKRLLELDHSVTVVDSFERGNKGRIDGKATIAEGDLLNQSFVKELFAKNTFDTIIHFAGYISMGESMQEPGMYFRNNVYEAINMLEEIKQGNTSIIFSSTAGVYGNPIRTPIDEDHPKNPTNPYGESKLMVERILAWYEAIYGIGFTCLRYFNASGAALDGSLGEAHNPETHIIPKAIEAILRHSTFKLFGTDYNTPDGTAVRDYIHVLDLVEAHVLAMNQLHSKKGAHIYNVGTGKGYSNKEIVAMIEKVTEQKFDVEYAPRRPGDAEVLVADPRKIQKELQFSPKYSDLETIIASAWKWHKNA